MKTDDRAAVEQANAEFYYAFESFEIERMEKVWAHEDWIRCVHPGWDVLTGWRRVRESWNAIFENEQTMKISASDTWIYVKDDFAWVTCTEKITMFFEDNFETSEIAATNLFIRRDDRWLMVHHHASSLPRILPGDTSYTIQ